MRACFLANTACNLFFLLDRAWCRLTNRLLPARCARRVHDFRLPHPNQFDNCLDNALCNDPTCNGALSPVVSSLTSAKFPAQTGPKTCKLALRCNQLKIQLISTRPYSTSTINSTAPAFFLRLLTNFPFYFFFPVVTTCLGTPSRQ